MLSTGALQRRHRSDVRRSWLHVATASGRVEQGVYRHQLPTTFMFSAWPSGQRRRQGFDGLEIGFDFQRLARSLLDEARTCLVSPGRVMRIAHAFLILGLCMLSELPVNGDSRLRIGVSPARSFAPATLRVRVWLDRNAENRTLAVVAASDDFYRSSEIQLDGEQAPEAVEFQFRDLPSGDYEVSGVLLDRTGRRRAAASERMKVISVG